VFDDYGTPDIRPIRCATPMSLCDHRFADGSMGPKVEAACRFVDETGGLAAIGALADAPAILRGEAGTWISPRGLRGLAGAA
jgi:carbamate kinase